MAEDQEQLSKRELRRELAVALAKEHGLRTANLPLNELVVLVFKHGLSALSQDLG
jgi:hypothetical protein